MDLIRFGLLTITYFPTIDIMVNNPFENKSKLFYMGLGLLIWLNVFSKEASGQIKYEKEHRITKKTIPPIASRFIDSAFLNTKQKWYMEESLSGKSIEAKITYKGSLYSIEFDTLGYIQDVEKTISLYDLSQNLRSRIIIKLDSIFSKLKIDKVQLQWLGSNQVLYELVEQGSSKLPYTLNYEIVLTGRKGKSMKLYEILFDLDGNILRIAEIAQKNSDNLDY